MQKSTVKRCIRPQCMELYAVTDKNKYCICGALLHQIEIDVKPKKNNFKDNPIEAKAYLYLMLEDTEVEFKLTSHITRIGRTADGIETDINLSEYAGKEVSREHAVIRKETDGYYITNISRNHSVIVLNQAGAAVTLEYGKSLLLKSDDGILLSKKVLLQFAEEE